MLEEAYGISQFSLRAAFMEMPAARNREAVAVCDMALSGSGDAEEAGDLVRGWAKENEIEMYHLAIV